MKNLLFILAFIGAAPIVSLQAQDLHIYFDAQTQAVRYEMDGVEVEKPKVKRGKDIYLHIENYNNYIYKIKVTETLGNPADQDLTSTSNSRSPFQASGLISDSGPLGSLFFPGGMGSGDMLGGLLDMGFNQSGSFGFAANEEQISQFRQMKQQMDYLIKDMSKLEVEFDDLYKDVRLWSEGRVVIDIALEEITKIKQNPDMTPAQIKKLTGEYFERIFGDVEAEDINMSYLIEQMDSKKALEKYLTELQSNEEKYKRRLNQFQEVESQMVSLDFESPDYITFTQQVQAFSANIPDILEDIKENKTVLSELMGTARQEDIKLLTRLRYEFEDLSNNEFSYTHRAEARGEELSFKVDLVEKAGEGGYGDESTKSLAPITVPVFGGFRINASAGVSFGQFMTRPQNFFVRDSLLLADDGDDFYPIITTFIHFYSQRPANITPAATFGIGFSLSNVETVQSPAFFGGISLLLGKADRLAITGGLFGGRVKQLSNGLKVGDTYEADPTFTAIPTTFKYKLGYFVGLSFNLL